MQIISQGAESIIYLKDNLIYKDRIEKKYRVPELDKKIRSSRTRKEVKILKKLNALDIPTAKYISDRDNVITMEWIEGIPVKDLEYTEGLEKVFLEIGKIVRSLHQNVIIHGDLTTGNFIYNEKVYIIDFGLSYVSTKVEDKAVDLYVFEKAMNCANNQDFIESFYLGYNDVCFNKDVMDRLSLVKKRGRKREKDMIG